MTEVFLHFCLVKTERPKSRSLLFNNKKISINIQSGIFC